ncbi:MAG: putative inorganic carbon transporter subunit DabA [Phycisphaerae bacterium]
MKRLLGLRDAAVDIPKLQWQIPLESRVQLVAGALRNMSVSVQDLAPIVLICGHGSRTENNPYGSSLDCGACGGHKGDVNARFAAALMNDPEVREELKGRGILIPADTVFVAGLHVTTTNEVVLYDSELLTHYQRGELQDCLRKASAMLGGEGVTRSRDWSEVRPEWGLAGNAACIAAPRSRTRSLDLGGRAFLHDYDSTADTDGSVLNLILAAPVVVASWINLQYYGSTVDNGLFGSGNKALHNVVGAFGVWEGNAGDLRTGLPIQSLHDGTTWVHEPLRLQVFVEARRESIDAVLAAHPEVRELVENDWIHLIAMDGDTFSERKPAGVWRRMGV